MVKTLFGAIALTLFTAASAEWTPVMTITSPQNTFDQAWCSADGQTATVTFGFHLASQTPSPADITYSAFVGDTSSTTACPSPACSQLSGPTYVADGIQPDGDWSYAGHGADKTYDSTFQYVFPGTGTYTVRVCARQPGLDHDNVCDEHTVVLACTVPTTDKCDKETDVTGKIGNGTTLSCKNTINFTFKGPYGKTTPVTVDSSAMVVDGNHYFTVSVDRNGASCEYNLQWKPSDMIAAGATIGTGIYNFEVGSKTYSANLDCSPKK